MSKNSRLKTQAKKTASRNKLYSKNLSTLAKFGIYNPVSNELTKYRKTRINRAMAEFGHSLTDPNVQFVRVPKQFKINEPSILKRARELLFPTTKTGIFVEKQGSRKARIVRNSKLKEFEIKLTGRTKRGPNAGNQITTIVPLAKIDNLAKEIKRLKHMAANLPLTKKSDRLIFQIIENGVEGTSHENFQNIGDLLKYLDKYQRRPSDKIQLYRHVQIQRRSVHEWLSLRKEAQARINKRKRRRVNKTGRNID